MSVEARIWAQSQQTAMMREKHVLLLLADRHNEKAGYAWPSLSRIQADGCMGVTTVKRAIKGLVEQGLVIVCPQSKKHDEGYASNRYYLVGHSKSVPANGTHFYVDTYHGPDGKWEGPGTDAYQKWHAPYENGSI